MQTPKPEQSRLLKPFFVEGARMCKPNAHLYSSGDIELGLRLSNSRPRPDGSPSRLRLFGSNPISAVPLFHEYVRPSVRGYPLCLPWNQGSWRKLALTFWSLLHCPRQSACGGKACWTSENYFHFVSPSAKPAMIQQLDPASSSVPLMNLKSRRRGCELDEGYFNVCEECN